MTQTPPFALQIEPVEGCTLACWFCGLQAIRDNKADATLAVHGKISTPYKFMQASTARRVVDEVRRLKWNPRVEFAMHGEPTLHKELPGFVEMFRDYSTMVTTNGAGVTKIEHVTRLFAKGLRTLAIDDYEQANYVARIREWVFEMRDFGIHVYEYPRDREGNPHARVREKRIVLIHDISDNTKGTHTLSNQGGNSLPPLEEPLSQRCAKPFRELSVRWNGDVAVCCDDWKGEYIVGNVNNMPLDALWNHPRFEAARRALYHGRRDLLKPCNVCNVRTYRNGLLPDKHGKETLPQANSKDREVMRDTNIRSKPR